MKNRIKSILNYKKPAFWIVVVSLVAVAVAAVCLLTNPVDDTPAGGETDAPVTTTTTTTTTTATTTQTTVGTTTTRVADTTNKTTATTKPAPQYNGPVTYEPLEIKSEYLKYDYVEGTFKIDAGEWSVLRFDSYEDVIDFQKANEKLPAWEQNLGGIGEGYNEVFFETKTLVFLSGKNTTDETVKLGKVSCDGKKFVVEMIFEKEDPHYIYLDWMDYWGYAFVMDKRAMETVTTFDAYETDVPYDISTCYAGDNAIEITFTPEAAAQKPDLNPAVLSETFGIEIYDAIDVSDLEYESAYEDVLLYVSERDPEKLDKMVEKVEQHPDVRYARLELHLEDYAEANFEEGKVLVTLTPEASGINKIHTPAELSEKFGVTITAVVDLTRPENQDALKRIDEDTYCQKLMLEIPQTGRRAVLDACSIIKQHEDVKNASPHYIWYDDVD